jgi:hypothetical protein
MMQRSQFSFGTFGYRDSWQHDEFSEKELAGINYSCRCLHQHWRQLVMSSWTSWWRENSQAVKENCVPSIGGMYKRLGDWWSFMRQTLHGGSGIKVWPHSFGIGQMSFNGILPWASHPAGLACLLQSVSLKGAWLILYPERKWHQKSTS